MRNPLRRCYGRGDLHFVTFSCFRRRAFLGTRRARNHFVKVLDQVRTRHKFQLLGYVVMPEHILKIGRGVAGRIMRKAN